MQANRDEIHPRPQLTRATWIDLSGPWGFAYDDAAIGLDEQWQARSEAFTSTIQVPFPPESAASGIGDQGFHPIVWYRHAFRVPDAYEGKRLLLHFGAVDYRAHIWVNGQLVVTHEGGHTPFFADITVALRPAEEQIVVVRAEDAPLDLAQPRGKQDWREQCHSIWYHRTTGIWQPVWLEAVSCSHITQIRWTPDLDSWQLGLAVKFHVTDNTSLRLRVQLSLHGELLRDDTYAFQDTELQRQITLDYNPMDKEAILWSPEHPNLIDVKLTLLADDEIIDEVQSYTGFRSVGTSNGRFLLNSHAYYLRFALEQGYWPESHLAAPSSQALRREVELAKELGLNGVRIHQKVEDPRFLYWCDRLGLLVWGEMPSTYIFSPTAVERFTREWLEVLARDYSHPCIVAWVPLNESWGVPNLTRDAAQRHLAQALYHLTKTLDPTRPTIGNDGWEHTVSDIYSVHDYTFHGSTIQQRYGTPAAVEHTLQAEQPAHRVIILPGFQHTNEPMMLTEVGGISYHPRDGEEWYGYGTVTSQEAYLAKYRELIEAILDCPTIAGFCYTQLTDTEQETNGLLTAQREPKLDMTAIRAITSRSR